MQQINTMQQMMAASLATQMAAVFKMTATYEFGILNLVAICTLYNEWGKRQLLACHTMVSRRKLLHGHGNKQGEHNPPQLQTAVH
jgi:hypothetical protein